MTLEEIYDAHADFVWRTLRRLGVPESDAPDATQEVFLTVHRALPQFEGRSSIPTWLFTICRSVERDRRRRAHRRYEIADAKSVDDEVDLSADASAKVEHNQRLATLQGILERIEPKQRTVFILFEIETMTGEEISEALSIPLGTVYSRLRLARAQFRQALSRREAQDEKPNLRAGGSKP
jgi:RNA polymerase sigma-70 factor (ECF subfamily)